MSVHCHHVTTDFEDIAIAQLDCLPLMIVVNFQTFVRPIVTWRF